MKTIIITMIYPPDQNNYCPYTSDLANVPTYFGQDRCVYPCPSYDDSNDQSNISQGCLLESPSQATSVFSIYEERPI